MDIIERRGDVFRYTHPGEALAHGCNTKGLMGAGVARIVRRACPVVYANYKAQCDAGVFVPGTAFAMIESDRWIFNLATQENPGANADLGYVKKAFIHAAFIAELYRIPNINMPQIGCGIGGLTWNAVKSVLSDIDSDVTLTVYTLV